MHAPVIADLRSCRAAVGPKAASLDDLHRAHLGAAPSRCPAENAPRSRSPSPPGLTEPPSHGRCGPQNARIGRSKSPHSRHAPGPARRPVKVVAHQIDNHRELGAVWASGQIVPCRGGIPSLSRHEFLSSAASRQPALPDQTRRAPTHAADRLASSLSKNPPCHGRAAVTSSAKQRASRSRKVHVSRWARLT